MSEHPRPAPESIRLQIIDALKDKKRRRLDESSGSKGFLLQHDIRAEGLFEDLVEFLEEFELFLKPKNSPHQPLQRYQCRIVYPEETQYPALEVHVTMSPKGDPVRVKVAVHKSDTVRQLDQIPLKIDKKENEN